MKDDKPEKTAVTPLSTEGQIVIEEKQSKPNGEVNIVQYVRGNFLGKVSFVKAPQNNAFETFNTK